MPDPLQFAGDRAFVKSRWRSPHTKAIAARDGERLVGSNIATRWGAFGFFGPLTVLPEYWDRGIGTRLLEATMKIFDGWAVRHTGLFTFANSAKHVGLYQKFGYWPCYLTALLTRAPEAKTASVPILLSELSGNRREQAIEQCRKLTGSIQRGLDLSGEIRSALRKRTGEIVLVYTRNALEAFAVCMNGPGSEGGEKICYVKFGAARSGAGAGERFERLLDACEAFALSRAATVEAGTNLAREDAFRRMRARGYGVMTQGVAMQRPHECGFNRGDVYVMDDWR